MNYSDPNLRRLQTFVTVASLGSFYAGRTALPLTRHVGVIQKSGRSPSPAAESFLKTLKDICKKEKK